MLLCQLTAVARCRRPNFESDATTRLWDSIVVLSRRYSAHHRRTWPAIYYSGVVQRSSGVIRETLVQRAFRPHLIYRESCPPSQSTRKVWARVWASRSTGPMAKTGLLSPLRAGRETKPGRYGDGGGLYLQVKPSGAKSWLFRYKQRAPSRSSKALRPTCKPMKAAGRTRSISSNGTAR
jgi:hypothetical protein